LIAVFALANATPAYAQRQAKVSRDSNFVLI